MTRLANLLSTRLLAAATSSLIGLASTGPALADTLWITVENWSGTEYVYDIRISSEYAGDWGRNYIGYDVLAPGFATDVPVDLGPTCYADILIETDWMVHEAYGVNICDVAAIVVGDGEAWFEYYDDAYYGH